MPPGMGRTVEGSALFILVGSRLHVYTKTWAAAQSRVRLVLDGYMRSTWRSFLKVRGSNRIAVDDRVAEGYTARVFFSSYV